MRLRRPTLFQRTLLLIVVAVTGAAVLLSVTLLSLRRPDDASRALNDRWVPAGESIQLVIRSSAQSQSDLLLALSTTDEAQRSALVGRAEAAGNGASVAWQRYMRLVVPTAAETRLRRQYESARASATEAGARVFTINRAADPVGFEAAATDEQRLASEAQATLGEIRSRFVDPEIARSSAVVADGVNGARRDVLIAFVVVLAVGLAIAGFVLRSVAADQRAIAHERQERRREARRSQLETELQRGLEMEATEEATFEIVADALRSVLPSVPAELLVADSSRAHFRQVLSTDPDGKPACPVGSPQECPATASGQLRLFLDSRRIDACPFLRHRGDDALWAACVPVTIAGRATGVIHVAAPIGTRTAPDAVQDVELIGRKVGERVGVLRVLARTQAQAQADPLTGLANRRTLENFAHTLIEHEDAFCVAFADLDHFKDLNDTHGHEMGDRALRLFARVLRDSVRPNDLPARYGGEEFVTVLPDCSLADAGSVAERLRSRLHDSLNGGTVAPFTVTVGIAARDPGEAFSEVLGRADAALLFGKEHGRDQVVSTRDLPARLRSVADDEPKSHGS